MRGFSPNETASPSRISARSTAPSSTARRSPSRTFFPAIQSRSPTPGFACASSAPTLTALIILARIKTPLGSSLTVTRQESSPPWLTRCPADWTPLHREKSSPCCPKRMFPAFCRFTRHGAPVVCFSGKAPSTTPASTERRASARTRPCKDFSPPRMAPSSSATRNLHRLNPR